MEEILNGLTAGWVWFLVDGEGFMVKQEVYNGMAEEKDLTEIDFERYGEYLDSLDWGRWAEFDWSKEGMAEGWREIGDFLLGNGVLLFRFYKRVSIFAGISSSGLYYRGKKSGLLEFIAEHDAYFGEVRKRVYHEKERVERKERTNLERYGAECVLGAEQIKAKAMATIVEKYGTAYPLQNAEFAKKRCETMVERYGVEHPLQYADFFEKVRRTTLERFGVEYPLQNAGVKEKYKATCLERSRRNQRGRKGEEV